MADLRQLVPSKRLIGAALTRRGKVSGKRHWWHPTNAFYFLEPYFVFTFGWKMGDNLLMDVCQEFAGLSQAEQKSQLTQWSQSYYDGNPEVEDVLFDKCLQIYKDGGGDDLGIGFGYKIVGGSVPHLLGTVGSLDKIRGPNLPPLFSDDEEVVIMPKMDGGSAVAYYRDGSLESVVSRGDGETGFDITKNVEHDIPKKISLRGLVGIRGEAMYSWTDFNEMTPINEMGIRPGHPRNKAVGISQSKHSYPDDVKRLRFVAYSVMFGVGPNENDTEAIKSVNLTSLDRMGFRTVTWFIVKWGVFCSMMKSPNSLIYEFNHSFYQDKKDQQPLPFDGLVVCPEDPAYAHKAIAFKFEDELAETTVTDIVWSLTATGKLHPVANITPVNLCGACISNVTLCSYDWLKKNFPNPIGVGSRIKIVRANMIIPKVVEVLTGSSDDRLPDECPGCKRNLVKDGAHFYCRSQLCTRYTDRLHYNVCGKFAPKFLGESILTNFFEKFDIKSIRHLILVLCDVNLPEKLDKRMTAHEAELLKVMVENVHKYSATVKDVLLLSGVPDLGDSQATELSKVASPSQFLDVVTNNLPIPAEWSPCLNVRAENNLKDALPRVKLVCEFFDNKIVEMEKPVVVASAGVTWAMTGKLELFESRDSMVNLLASKGVTWLDPNKKPTYFVCNKASTSAKYMAAVNLGLKIVTERQFVDVLKRDHGIDLGK